MHVRDLKSPPEVGRHYLVDCIAIKPHPQDADERDWDRLTTYLPVLGPAHDDREFGITVQHYHLDQRFLPAIVLAEAGPFYVVHAGDPKELWSEPRLFECFRTNFPTRVSLPGLTEKCVKEDRRAVKKDGAWHCPHKGTYLGNLTVSRGCLTCPMHGLRIKTWTGKVSGKTH